MKLNIRERIFIIGLIVSVILFFIINAVSYWSTKKHIESRAEIEKTLACIHELENLASMIKDAETGQRGYLITGDWAFLEPYYIGVTAVHKSMNLLKDMNADEALILERLDKILKMIERRFEQFHKAISLRKDGDVPAAVRSFTEAEKENIMPGIRNLIEESKIEHNLLLLELSSISKKRSQLTLFAIVIGNLFAFLFVFFSFFQLYRDITERGRTEEALRESEEKYRAVVESANDPIAIVVDGVIVFSNQAFMSVLGYETNEVNGMKLTMFSPPENMDEVVNRYRRRMAGEKLSRLWETTLLHKDGTKLPVESSGCLIQYKGKPADLILIRDITDRKKAEEELRASQNILRSLAGRLEKIREEERILISREIHDVMGGGLTGLKMDLARLHKNIPNAGSDEERKVIAAQIAALSNMADDMIRVTRRISSDLRPPVLDDYGLIPAMEWQLSEFTARTGVLHEFKTTFENVIFKNEQAVAMFRIFQEALTNIARHSGATEIEVVLREDERSLFMDRNFVLEIRDNGRGITEEEIMDRKSLGLLGMKERALAFGGELQISGEPGEGTVISIKMPRDLKGENNDQGDSG